MREAKNNRLLGSKMTQSAAELPHCKSLAGTLVTSASQVANFRFSALLISMGIKYTDHAALLDFTNVIRLNKSNSGTNVL